MESNNITKSTHTRTSWPLWLGIVALAFAILACGGGTVVPPTLTAVPATVAPTQPSPTNTTTTATKSGDVKFITKVVMAKDTKGDKYEPVDETIVFAPDATFHAIVSIENAPKNTTFKADWTAVDVRDAKPNTSIDSYELMADGSRNLDFTLKPKSAWPEGSYRVEIYANDTLARTVDFSVRGETTSTSPTTVSPSTYIEQVVTAKDVASDTFEPQNVTMSFTPDDKVIHLVVKIKDAPKNTQFRVVWYLGKQEIKGGSTSLTADGTRYLDFTLKQTDQQWPVGDYSVDLVVNDNFKVTSEFSVK